MRRHPGDTGEGDNVRSRARLYTDHLFLLFFHTIMCACCKYLKTIPIK